MKTQTNKKTNKHSISDDSEFIPKSKRPVIIVEDEDDDFEDEGELDWQDSDYEERKNSKYAY